MILKALTFSLLAIPTVCGAVSLDLPANAVLSDRSSAAFDSYSMPTGAWTGELVPMRSVEGPVAKQVWKIDGNNQTTLQLLAPIRQQLEESGFEVVYECRTDECGGFDFRFALDLAPSPLLQVNLNDYRYLAAEDSSETVVIFVSRTSTTGFIQIVRIGQVDGPDTLTTNASVPVAQTVSTVVENTDSATLESAGHLILGDLIFESGSANLGQGPYPSLESLAAFLTSNPERIIALVGHTDSSGSLEANIEISRRRAAAVRQRLIDAYGISPDRLEANGMGYLAPVASNLTEEGRAENRRVEAILLD